MKKSKDKDCFTASDKDSARRTAEESAAKAADEKERLRGIFSQRLAEISDDQAAEKSKRACTNLISTKQFEEAGVIMFYLAMPKEADATGGIICSWEKGKTVVVPRVFWREKKMTAVRIDSLEGDFAMERCGLRNPRSGDEVSEEKIDLIIVPGLAFDRRGNRLGRGGGYYDKFLAQPKLRAKKCGFCFAEQLLEQDNLAAGPQDIGVDLLITDKEIIFFN
jgi:5-formyltetrahydrofolate cyclo-ligase